MTFKTWLLFFVMETALSLAPGPAVFYAVTQGARGGAARTLPAALGILSANALYFALSATSLGALIAASARFFTVVKWAGAAYLVYLGVRALASAGHSQAVALNGGVAADSGSAAKGAEAAAGAAGARGAAAVQGAAPATVPDQHDRRRVYLGALTLQLANPKALLFFLALLPQFIDLQASVATQMLILAATSMIPEFCILMGYGWLAHRALHASARFGVTGGMNRWLARIEGLGLLGCATLVLNFNRGD